MSVDLVYVLVEMWPPSRSIVIVNGDVEEADNRSGEFLSEIDVANKIV